MVRWISIILLILLIKMLSNFIYPAYEAATVEGALVYVNWANATGLIIIPLLWIYSARKKRLVLFLRHFKHARANRMLSQSIYGSLRPIARLVVLDDQQFSPISVPTRERVVMGISAAAIIVTVVALLNIGLSTRTPVQFAGQHIRYNIDAFVTILKPGETQKTESYGFVNIATRNGAYSETQTLIAIVTEKSEIFNSINQRSLASSIRQSGPILVIVALLFLLGYRVLFRGWEASKTISSTTQIPKVLRGLVTLRWRIRAPRPLGALATVITTADSIWKPVVQNFIEKVDWVVLDISNPTESIVWELETAIRLAPAKLIILRDNNAILDEQDPLQAELILLLEDVSQKRILEYGENTTRKTGRILAKLIRT